jgi:hypothetical protein
MVRYGHRMPQLLSSSRFNIDDNSYQLDDFVFRKQRLVDSFVILAVICKEC